MDDAYLGISRIGVKHIAEEFAGHGHASDNQPVDVVRVDHKRFTGDLGGQFGHSIKVDEEREKNFVGGGTVLVNAEEVCFKGNCGDVASMER